MMDRKSKKTQTPEMAFGFSGADLHDNRSGRLSTEQRDRLAEVARRYRTRGGLWSALTGIFAVGLAFTAGAVTEAVAAGGNAAGIPAMVVLSALLLGLPSFSAARNFRKQRAVNRDIASGAVREITGLLTLPAFRRPMALVEERSFRSVKIGNESFQFQLQQVATLKNQEPYTIYVAPSSREVVALEWLRARSIEPNLLPADDDESLEADYNAAISQQRRIQSENNDPQ